MNITANVGPGSRNVVVGSGVSNSVIVTGDNYNYCEDCTFWDKPVFEWAQCLRVRMKDSKATAHTVGGGAMFTTAFDFGCVQWKRKNE